jgi:hypothetical protein
VAFTDQNWKAQQTTVREAGQTPRFEGDLFIEEKVQTPEIPFILDDLIAMLQALKSQQNVPGTARVGSAVMFSLRW